MAPEIELRPRALLQRLGYAALEVGWAYPWWLALTRHTGQSVARWGPWTLFTVCLASALASVEVRRRLPLAQARGALTILGLVLAGLLSGGAIAGFLASLYFWWRGFGVAQASLGAESAILRFRWAFLAAVVAVLVSLIFGPPLAASPYLVAVFGIGLVTVALGRMASSGASGLSPAATLRWLGILAGSVGAVVLTALAGLALLRSRLFQVLWEPVGAALDRVLWAALLGFAYLLSPLLSALLSLFSGWAARMEFDPFQRLEEVRRNLEAAAPEGPPAGGPALEMLRWLLIGLALGGVVLVLALSVGRRERGGEPEDEGEREALLEGRAGVGRALGDALAGWLEDPLDVLRARWPGEPGPWTVRRIYRDLLRRSAQRGFPRRPPQTALEFQARLEAAFPGHEPEISVLTRAYLLVRYRDEAPTPGELSGLLRAYQRVVRDGR